MILTANIEPAKTDGWDCFRFYYTSYPDYSNVLAKLYLLQKKACTIYTLRAQAGTEPSDMTYLVEDYKNTLESLPDNSAGYHTLVFSSFLVSLEAILPAHREFFEQVMLSHYHRNGFGNILLALQYLRAVWASECQQDWTKGLTSLQGFIV